MTDTCEELTEKERQLLQPDGYWLTRLLKASDDKSLHYLIPKLLINEKETINVKEEEMQVTPLHVALWRGCSLETLDVLLDAGADVTARDTDDYNGLHASLLGKCHLPVIKKLLHCNKEMVHQRNNYELTPLMVGLLSGCSFEVFRELVEAGADLTVLDNCKIFELHLATIGGCCKEILEEIIRRKPDLIHLQDMYGRIPLHFATEEWVVKTLIEAGSDAGARDEDGNTPLQRALKWKKISDSTLNVYLEHMSSEQIQHVNNDDETLLHTVCRENYEVEVVRRLIMIGLDPAKRNKKGETALELLAYKSAPKACKELLRGHPYLFGIKNNDGESVLEKTQNIEFATEIVKWVCLQNEYLAQHMILEMKSQSFKKDIVSFLEKCQADLKLLQEHRVCGIIFLKDLLLKYYLTEDDTSNVSFLKEFTIVLAFDASCLSVFREEVCQLQKKVLENQFHGMRLHSCVSEEHAVMPKDPCLKTEVKGIVELSWSFSPSPY